MFNMSFGLRNAPHCSSAELPTRNPKNCINPILVAFCPGPRFDCAYLRDWREIVGVPQPNRFVERASSELAVLGDIRHPGDASPVALHDRKSQLLVDAPRRDHVINAG